MLRVRLGGLAPPPLTVSLTAKYPFFLAFRLEGGADFFQFQEAKIFSFRSPAQVEGEVLCNSIMAVAHGVMLTCDLVYNRCHLQKEIKNCKN